MNSVRWVMFLVAMAAVILFVPIKLSETSIYVCEISGMTKFEKTSPYISGVDVELRRDAYFQRLKSLGLIETPNWFRISTVTEYLLGTKRACVSAPLSNVMALEHFCEKADDKDVTLLFKKMNGSKDYEEIARFIVAVISRGSNE